MKRNELIKGSMLFLFICLAFSIAGAQIQMNYQGRLTDDIGTPLNDTVDITFGIYAMPIGTSLLWSETHLNVTVSSGLFSVILGSETTLPDSVFMGNDRYLGITVGTDPELSPRTLLTSAPSAAYAKRVAGDLTTSPGHMVLNNTNGDSAVCISSQTDGRGLITSFKMIEPGDDGSPIMEMKANGVTNTFTYRIIEPADDDKPVYHFMADGPNQAVTWGLADPLQRPSAEFISVGIANTIDFRLILPPEMPAVDILSDAGNN